MIRLDIPGRNQIELKYLVLDVNGTIAVDGNLVDDVAQRLAKIGKKLKIHLLTADTHGKQAEIDQLLGFSATRIPPRNEAERKAEIVNKIGAKNVIAIGNGANDSLMLKAATIGVVVCGTEGAAMSTVQNADILCTNTIDALDLVLRPKRLTATLRK